MCFFKRFQHCFDVFIVVNIIILTSSMPYAMGEPSKCEKLTSLARWTDHNTIVETTLRTLAGTWISEGCETRPGPQYVLRSYTFNSDGFYNLIQHHYWDDSCSSPKLTLITHGRIQLRNSLIQPGACNGYCRPFNITLIPQDSKTAKELDDIVSTECPNQYFKSWRRYEEHVVFDSKERKIVNLWTSSYVNSGRSQIRSSGDINCLGSYKWAFNELKLLKVQLRPIFNQNKHPQEVEVELLLGDIHSNERKRFYYIPQSFQKPLLRQSRNENITIKGQNYFVKNSFLVPNFFIISGRTPPHFVKKPHLPPYIYGEWTSTRCETRPLGLYLTRLFTFYEEDSTWVGEHRFYSDPFCKIEKFIVTAGGHFNLIGPSDIMEGASDIDFIIEKATLTILDHRMIQEMRLPGYCGRDKWIVNVPKDLSSTNGCVYLNIVIPSTLYDVMKVEMDYSGDWLLFLGQPDTNNEQRTERPTAFQYPLVKCGEVTHYSNGLRDLLYLNDASYCGFIKRDLILFLFLLQFVLN